MFYQFYLYLSTKNSRHTKQGHVPVRRRIRHYPADQDVRGTVLRVLSDRHREPVSVAPFRREGDGQLFRVADSVEIVAA